jgi:N-acetylneuraminic acid mutarotase
MKKLNSLILLVLFGLSLTAQYSWVTKNPFSGTPSQNATGFAIGNNGYVVVGLLSRNGPIYTNQVWSYNPSGDNWSQKSNFPQTLAGSVSFVINDTAYVAGGQTTGLSLVNNTYAYNAAADSWSPKSGLSVGGDNQATFVINGIGYIATGAYTGSNASVSAYSYTPSTDTWSPIANFGGSACVNAVGFAIGNYGYVGLGGNGAGTYFNSFYKYDPSANSWSSIAAFPGVARSGAVAFVIDGIAYVGSGVTYAAGSSSPYTLGDFYAYDPTSNTWTAVPGLPGNSRTETTAFSINNHGYVVGGFDFINTSYFNLVSEFASCQTISGIVEPGPTNNNIKIEVYPNPSSVENLAVKINADVNSSMEYIIASVDGKQIMLNKIRQNQFEINTAGLSNGVYILSVKDASGPLGFSKFEVIH